MKKIIAFNAENNIFQKLESRPFYFNKHNCEITNNYEEADYIFGYLHYLNCNQHYEKIKQSEIFKKHANKFVFYSMHDSPTFAYKDTSAIKFLSQPLNNDIINNQYNIISVPLTMRHFEWKLIQDKDFIEECRNQEKKYDFVFIGQPQYGNRQWLKNIKNCRFLYRETKHIYHIQNVNKRVELIKTFCREIAQAKYGFSPRGVGSSSFRLYQNLMVGTVPVYWGMNSYPFKEFVDWDDFSICIDGNINQKFNVNSFLNKYNKNYEKLKENGINFWENYVRMNVSDQKLFENYL